MSLRRPAKEQPETFEFNSSSFEAANAVVSVIINKPKNL